MLISIPVIVQMREIFIKDNTCAKFFLSLAKGNFHNQAIDINCYLIFLQSSHM